MADRGSEDAGDRRVDRRPIALGESAIWDDRLDAFRVKAHGNRDIGGVVILRWAKLPIGHLDSSAPNKATRLGQILRERLEVEVNSAIARGDRAVQAGIALLSAEETKKL